MTKVHMERGRILDVKPEIVLCLCENFDVWDAVLDQVCAQKLQNGVFKAERGGAQVRHELLSSEVHSGWGMVKYLITISKLGLQLQTVSAMKYSSTIDNRTSVECILDLEASGISGMVLKFFEKRSQKLADEAITNLDKACTIISKHPEEARKKLTDEQIKILGRYLAMDKEEELTSSHHVSLNIFPSGESSIVKLETNVPKNRKTFLSIESQEKDFSKFFSHIIELGGLYTRGSVDIQKKSVKRFQKSVYQLGRDLHDTYIKEELHAYLVSALDHSDGILLQVTSDGKDALIPWELLHDGDDYLCMKTNMVRVATTIPEVSPYKARIDNILVVGSYPDDSSKYEQLPEVENEVKAIEESLSHIIGVKLLCGEDATKEKVLKEIRSGKYQALHFSGHSFIDKDVPFLSYLVLRGDAELSVEELKTLATETDLQLVFLNSCYSGANEFIGTKELMGFADALLKSHIPYVVGMQWSVTDQGASNFAKEFYDQILHKKRPEEAVRIARRRTGEIFDWKDPIWAAPIIYAAHV